MRIHVRYFAVVRERLGSEGEDVELPAGADVAAVLARLGERHEPLRSLVPYLRVAVNHTVVPLEHALVNGDEVALIPPSPAVPIAWPAW